jgi:hypothetical protein
MLPFRIVRIGGTAFRRQATCYSVISQLISINQPLGNQFMIFAKGRIKLPFRESRSIKGWTISSPFQSPDTVSIGIPPLSHPAFSSFRSRPSFAVRSFACDATVAPTSGA